MQGAFYGGLLILFWIPLQTLRGQEVTPFTADEFQHSANAQVPVDLELLEDSESLETDFEALEELREHPVNLNCMLENELERLFWLSPFQIQSILAYVQRNGSIKSFYEIPYIYGFSQKDASTLVPYVCLLNRGEVQQSRWKSEIKSLSASSGVLRNQIKLAYQNRYSAQMRVLWLADMKTRPDIKQLGGSMEWRGGKYLRQFIIGDFGTKWGQGLIVHQGLFKTFSSQLTQMTTTHRVQALSIHPDYPHFRGAYLSAALGRFRADLAYSMQDSIQEFARISWNNPHISCGIQGTGNLASGRINGSFDINLHWEKHQICSEVAILNNQLSAVAGYLFQPFYQQKVGIMAQTSTEYHSLEGLFEYARSGWNVQFTIGRRVWNVFRYRIALPAEDVIQRAQLSYQFKLFKFLWKWNKRADYLNATGILNTKSVLPYVRERHRFRIEYPLSTHLQINTEYQYCGYQTGEKLSAGNALVQEIQAKSHREKWNMRLYWSWFNSKDFNSALYVFETNYLNRFSIPALSGAGQRWNFQLAYKPKREQLYTIECAYQKEWKCTMGIRIRW